MSTGDYPHTVESGDTSSPSSTPTNSTPTRSSVDHTTSHLSPTRLAPGSPSRVGHNQYKGRGNGRGRPRANGRGRGNGFQTKNGYSTGPSLINYRPQHNQYSGNQPSMAYDQPSAEVQQTGWIAYERKERRPDWQRAAEIKVQVGNMPSSTKPVTLHKHFRSEGWISRIEVSRKDGIKTGYITFRPPPLRPFWEMPFKSTPIFPNIRLSLLPNQRERMQRSPVNPDHEYPEKLMLVAERVEFGFIFQKSSMMNMVTVQGTPTSKVRCVLDLFRKNFEIQFPYLINSSDQGNKREDPKHRETKFMVRIPLVHLEKIYEDQDDEHRRVLIIPLDSPPRFYRRILNVESSFDPDENIWNEWQAWVRQTDIVHDKTRQRIWASPTGLRNDQQLVNIGRWTTYRMVFERQHNDRTSYDRVLRALADYNVQIVPKSGLTITQRQESQFWNLIAEAETTSQLELTALEHLNTDLSPLEFPVRYQLEACISQGMLNEHNIKRDFLVRLGSMVPLQAKALLEKVVEMKCRVYDPMEIFNLHVSGNLHHKLSTHCVYMHSATITPSLIYINTPFQEITNRIVRQYQEVSDRFLRVRFMDEITDGILQGMDDDKSIEVLSRVKRVMARGINIAGRHYEFLAFGNSQFREHGAYFFAPTEDIKPHDMREFMGDFADIKVVAKYCARIGQCFSTTRAIQCGAIKVSTTDDIKRNGYCFSDGVGKISRYLLIAVATEWGIPLDSAGDHPSVVQFRLGGCKGVLALDNNLETREIVLRRSQYKFPATHSGLEIVKVSAFVSAQLNRQVITVLSNLGVKDSVFVDKMQQALSDMDEAMKSQDKALSLLQRYVDFNQMTLTLASMVLDGFMQHKDPFTISVLKLWRTWKLKYLKEKASIVIDDSAFLLGCVDETGRLKGHEERLQSFDHLTRDQKLEHLPEVFLQVSDYTNKRAFRIIQGICILARNPSLHPGDIRIVRAVDEPSLRHLKNVVVLPQQGERDVSNMCSGGDLDGDDYMVIWDQSLLPEEINHPPMDYTAPKPEEKDVVTVNDLTSFFVNYIKNDKLGSIATAHLGYADLEDEGIRSEKCLELAQLHSVAVDYPKTGIPAKLPKTLRLSQRPHYMKTAFSKQPTYTSRKILGQLFDQVQRESFEPIYDSPFDSRVLGAYKLDEEVLKAASDVKIDYDRAMRRSMAQFAIETEFEAWSTFVLSHNAGSDYQFHEEIGRNMTALRNRFHKICVEKAGSNDFEKLGPFVAAMYTVTSEEVSAAMVKDQDAEASNDLQGNAKKAGPKRRPLMSFPWIFVKEMGQIATGKHQTPGGLVAAQQAMQRRHHHRKAAGVVLASSQDDLQTAQGTTHLGDMLELFEDANEGFGKTVPIDDFVAEHAAMIDRGVTGPKHDQHPHDDDGYDPDLERKDWAPTADVLEAIRAASEDGDHDGGEREVLENPEHVLLDIFGDAIIPVATTPTVTSGVVLENEKRRQSALDDLSELLEAFSIEDMSHSAILKADPEQNRGSDTEDKENTGVKEVSDEDGGEKYEAEEVIINFDERPSALDILARLGNVGMESDDDDEL